MFRFVQQLMKTKAMQSIGAEIKYDRLREIASECSLISQDTDDYWECIIRYTTNPENHQVSTCHMGPSTDG